MATFVHMVGYMGRVPYKGNEAKSEDETPLRYAHPEIRTQVVVICGQLYKA